MQIRHRIFVHVWSTLGIREGGSPSMHLFTGWQTSPEMVSAATSSRIAIRDTPSHITEKCINSPFVCGSYLVSLWKKSIGTLRLCAGYNSAGSVSSRLTLSALLASPALTYTIHQHKLHVSITHPCNSPSEEDPPPTGDRAARPQLRGPPAQQRRRVRNAYRPPQATDAVQQNEVGARHNLY